VVNKVNFINHSNLPNYGRHIDDLQQRTMSQILFPRHFRNFKFILHTYIILVNRVVNKVYFINHQSLVFFIKNS
jgi:hypothetical protein